MSYYRDELAVVAKNSDSPIPFQEAAAQGTDGKRLVFVHHTVQSSHESFRRLRALFPPSMVKKVKERRILLTNDAELMFLTVDQIEHNALRGLGKVVWVC